MSLIYNFLDAYLMNVFHVHCELYFAVCYFIFISTEIHKNQFNQSDMQDFGSRYLLCILLKSKQSIDFVRAVLNTVCDKA